MSTFEPIQISSLNNSTYRGLAEVGKIKWYMQNILSVFLGIILLVCGIYFATKKTDVNIVNSVAKVMKSNCSQIVEGKTIMYACTLDISYDVNGKTYETNIAVKRNNLVKEGDTINVTYDKSNPTDVKESTLSTHLTGYILISVGLFILVSTFIYYYFTKDSYAYFASNAITSIVQ